MSSFFFRSQGLTVPGASPLGTRIGFHGTRDEVQRTFHAEMHDYVVAGKQHFALSTAPAVPTSLADVVLGIKGLHDFHPRKAGARVHPPAPQVILGKDTVLGPPDFQVLYDTKPLIAAGTDGSGVNIAVVGQTYYSKSDVATFLTRFALTNRITDVLVPGTGAQKVTDDLDEAELDLMWASAVAPGANIVFVYTGADADEYSVDDAAAYVVEQGLNLVPGTGNGGAQILSESYGGCDGLEPDDPALIGEVAAAANLEGITYVAASGDDGAAGCIEQGVGGLSVGPPSSLPGVTGVGGTEFPGAAQRAPYFVNHAAQEYPVNGSGVLLETAWNDLTTDPDTNGGGGGGGASTLFGKPFYQEGMTPADGARDVPDVSLSASPVELPYYLVLDGKTTAIGGTSAATPAFAGILALVGQAVKAAGGPLGLGNVNPLLYTLARSAPEVFHDIVSGDNETPCLVKTDPDCPKSGSYGGYSAAAGYDQVTGLGTIDAAKLVAAWSALAPTTTTVATSTSSTAVTLPVVLRAHVGSSGGGSLTGTVSFTFQTLAGPLGAGYAPDGGGFDESQLLGTVPVTTAGSSATLSSARSSPRAIGGTAYVVAMYNGDPTHLASISGQTSLSVTGSSLVIGPSPLTVQPDEKTTLTASGGTPPLRWYVLFPDTSCLFDDAAMTSMCSDVEADSPATTATFTAGPQDGALRVLAIDALGEESYLAVTVAGPPFVDAGAGDAGSPADAGSIAVDAGAPAHDAGELQVADSGATDASAGGAAGAVVTPAGARSPAPAPV